jgi:hypothetical protein
LICYFKSWLGIDYATQSDLNTNLKDHVTIPKNFHNEKKLYVRSHAVTVLPSFPVDLKVTIFNKTLSCVYFPLPLFPPYPETCAPLLPKKYFNSSYKHHQHIKANQAESDTYTNASKSMVLSKTCLFLSLSSSVL